MMAAEIPAEEVRFELTGPFGPPVFKTGAFNRSATLPNIFPAYVHNAPDESGGVSEAGSIRTKCSSQNP